ncbi:MAG: LysM domain-containing protein, partial [Chloroflexota bacterium]
MSTENATKSTKLCPTCGTRLKEDAERCLVCGSSLTAQDTPKRKSDKGVRGSQMPKITLGLPAAVGLLALFLTIGAVMVFFGLQRTGRVTEPTATPTVTLTVTPTMTPTPATPTVTPTMMPSPTPFTYVVQSGDTCGGIAVAFDISVQSIVRTNNLPAACDTLYDGQSLL